MIFASSERGLYAIAEEGTVVLSADGFAWQFYNGKWWASGMNPAKHDDLVDRVEGPFRVIYRPSVDDWIGDWE